MHEQSTGHRWQSPPSWHTQEPTTVMPSQAPAQAPRRRGWRVGEAVAATVTVALTATLALGAGYVIGAGRASAACEEALAYSDELNTMSEEYSTLVGRMLEAAFSFDEAAVAEVEADGEAFAERYADKLAAYETAAEDCSAAGGVL